MKLATNQKKIIEKDKIKKNKSGSILLIIDTLDHKMTKLKKINSIT